MSKYTVVIKNRFADEQTVARICSFESTEYFTKEEAEMSADIVKRQINSMIDNDIYFSDIEVEENDYEYKEYCERAATSHEWLE